MPRWIAIVSAVVAAASGAGVTVQAAPFGTSASGSSAHSTSPAIRYRGTANRAGASDAWRGGHTGVNPSFQFGSHDTSGWHQRGFGGTRDPGWGYNFGPHLGGFGH